MMRGIYIAFDNENPIEMAAFEAIMDSADRGGLIVEAVTHLQNPRVTRVLQRMSALGYVKGTRSGKSHKDFCREADIDPVAFSHWINGERALPFGYMNKIMGTLRRMEGKGALFLVTHNRSFGAS